MQSTTLSTYDQIILKGKIEGKIEGKAEHASFVARKLLLKFPQWTDEQIADLSGSEMEAVKKMRTKLSMKKASPKRKKDENSN